MKKTRRTVNLTILGLFTIGFFALNTLYAKSASQIVEKHLAQAASYEKQAADLDRFIAEHEQSKKDYPKTWVIDPTLVPDESDVRWMNGHCDKIIRDAKNMKQNLLEMAERHRTLAAHPEAVPKPVHVSEMMLSVSDHSGWTKEYEASAEEQDIVIAEHDKAKQNYKEPVAQKHCDTIIENAERLRDSFLEFAKWHRMQTSGSERELAQ